MGARFEKHCKAGENRKSNLSLTPRALDVLVGYHWPGNVCQLENVIERAVVLCLGEVTRPGDAEHLAGLLAAKEAAFKALGSGWGGGVGWRDPVVERSDTGAPRLVLAGNAAARAAALAVRTVHLSITHTGGVAVAVVILET